MRRFLLQVCSISASPKDVIDRPSIPARRPERNILEMQSVHAPSTLVLRWKNVAIFACTLAELEDCWEFLPSTATKNSPIPIPPIPNFPAIATRSGGCSIGCKIPCEVVWILRNLSSSRIDHLDLLAQVSPLFFTKFPIPYSQSQVPFDPHRAMQRSRTPTRYTTKVNWTRNLCTPPTDHPISHFQSLQKKSINTVQHPTTLPGRPKWTCPRSKRSTPETRSGTKRSQHTSPPQKKTHSIRIRRLQERYYDLHGQIGILRRHRNRHDPLPNGNRHAELKYC